MEGLLEKPKKISAGLAGLGSAGLAGLGSDGGWRVWVRRG